MSPNRKQSTKASKGKAPLPAQAKSSAIAKKKTAKTLKPKLIPERIAPVKLGDYLEVMAMATFQAGVSWALIQNKWDNFIRAFQNFDPSLVSQYKKKDIEKMLLDPGIIRSEKKIAGTVENARTMLMLEEKFGSFEKYLRSFNSYEELSADIQERFQFVGDLSVYYFLFRVGEPVPDFDCWLQTIEGEHPRMRELVEKYSNYEKRSLLSNKAKKP